MFGDHFLYSRDPMFDQVVILYGEIRCLLKLGLKGLSSDGVDSLMLANLEQSLFSLRGRRAKKKTREQVRNRLPRGNVTRLG